MSALQIADACETIGGSVDERGARQREAVVGHELADQEERQHDEQPTEERRAESDRVEPARRRVQAGQAIERNEHRVVERGVLVCAEGARRLLREPRLLRRERARRVAVKGLRGSWFVK